MKLDAFAAYCLFISLRNHFTQESYDYFKYGGKIRASNDSFMVNRDRFKFHKLSKKYSDEELRDFYIANLIAGKTWIGEFFEDEAEARFKSYVKRKQAFSYQFQQEVLHLFANKNPKDVFAIKSDQYPEILTEHLNGNLSPESLAVLNIFTDFSSRFDQKIGKDDILWSKIRLLIRKLTPFLVYDREKIKAILRASVFS